MIFGLSGSIRPLGRRYYLDDVLLMRALESFLVPAISYSKTRLQPYIF